MSDVMVLKSSNCEGEIDGLRTQGPVVGLQDGPQIGLMQAPEVIVLVIFGKEKKAKPKKLPIRSSPAFHDRLKLAAKSAGTSLNEFAFQVLESGLAIHEVSQKIGEELDGLRRKGESRTDFLVRLVLSGVAREREAERKGTPKR